MTTVGFAALLLQKLSGGRLMEEARVEKGGNGKVVGIVAIIIAVIALIIALSNLGVKGELQEVKKVAKEVASKEAALELKAKEMELVSVLDRIYVLTMVERDYQSAAVEFARAERLFAELKPFVAKDKVADIEKTFAALKGEIDRGPSPIPMLIAKLRTDLVSSVSLGAPVAVKAAEVEKKAEVKPQPKKVEIKRPVAQAKPAEEEEASGLKKTYLFWKRLGESLVHKK